MSYEQFKNEAGEAYGSFEVFYAAEGEYETLEDGWYWWPCFPGCMPDSETPNGPFETKQEAIDNAQSSA